MFYLNRLVATIFLGHSYLFESSTKIVFHTTHLFRDVSCLRMQFFGQRSLWFWWANCRKIKVFMFVPSSHCVWIFKINWSISYVKSRKGISKAVSVNRWWYDEKRKYVVVHSVTTRFARRNWTWKKYRLYLCCWVVDFLLIYCHFLSVRSCFYHKRQIKIAAEGQIMGNFDTSLWMRHDLFIKCNGFSIFIHRQKKKDTNIFYKER